MNFFNMVAVLLHLGGAGFFIYAAFTKGNTPMRIAFFIGALFLLAGAGLFFEIWRKNRYNFRDNLERAKKAKEEKEKQAEQKEE